MKNVSEMLGTFLKVTYFVIGSTLIDQRLWDFYGHNDHYAKLTLQLINCQIFLQVLFSCFLGVASWRMQCKIAVPIFV